MADAGDESREREPRSWVVRRWAAPLALSVSVAASIGAVHLLVDGPAATAALPGGQRMPRFVIEVGEIGSSPQEGGPKPWFQVRAAGAAAERGPWTRCPHRDRPARRSRSSRGLGDCSCSPASGRRRARPVSTGSASPAAAG
ncbi:hypothetical protein ACFQY7_19205 [Actinomadura luteofluorescens]|uniref:hypothetical protein n=1 Tax=Actinomadura luteofluorescens TaxID=46163 RepID=UPI0036344749